MAHPIPNAYEDPDQLAATSQSRESGTADAAADTPRLQFGMATGFQMVTGFCILVSLATWLPVGGPMFGSLIVGSWWCCLAVGAGRRRLAYYLAVWPMGTIVFAVFLGGLPMTAMAIVDSPPEEEMFGTGLVLFAMMAISCFACLVTVRVLRRRIRKPGDTAKASLQAVYLTAFVIVALFGLLAGTAEVLTNPGMISELPEILVVVPFAAIAFAFGTTLLLPVAWPISAGFCVILRRIDPDETTLSRETAWPSGRVPGQEFSG